ncbi:putative transcription factor WD40-like family [Helianthus annuus]|nr:putative transcription factor WD40-like family [Helianthus annuus]
MEPMNFTTANENCNCFSYDARKLVEAKCVHEDHVPAVMDIDYSPTGREFVTGSYDRTVSWLFLITALVTKHSPAQYFIGLLQVRIFQYNGGHSSEIYHTKRMQRFVSLMFVIILV